MYGNGDLDGESEHERSAVYVQYEQCEHNVFGGKSDGECEFNEYGWDTELQLDAVDGDKWSDESEHGYIYAGGYIYGCGNGDQRMYHVEYAAGRDLYECAAVYGGHRDCPADNMYAEYEYYQSAV